MAFEWKDKVVLITGAATGIGAEIVKILVETENVKHVTILDVDNAGTTLQDTLNLKYGRNKVKFVKCDATDDGQLFGAFKDVLDSYGYIDVVVNNAGIMNDAINLYKKEIELNVTALCTSSLKALELMRKDEGGQGGTIINIASIAALIQHPMMPIYFATKSAVLQFSSCLGLDQFYSRTGVRVITLCFGAINTSLLTTSKLGSFDKVTHNSFVEIIKQFPMQSAESAARGLIEAYKKGKSGSTWLATTNRPVKDITNNIKRAYEIMSEDVFD